MREGEKNKQPEIDFKAILNVIDNLELTFDDYEAFEYMGTGFLIIPDDNPESLRESGGAWYINSTAIDGFDIYLQESLSKEQRKRRLFHEVLEINLRDKQGFGQEDAHNIAQAKEQEVFGDYGK